MTNDHQYAGPQLILHDHFREHSQPTAVACYQAQHGHVIHLCSQSRADASGRAQCVELGAQRVPGSGECDVDAVEVFGDAQALRLPTARRTDQ